MLLIVTLLDAPPIERYILFFSFLGSGVTYFAVAAMLINRDIEEQRLKLLFVKWMYAAMVAVILAVDFTCDILRNK